jgi:hypothetical protein
MGRNEASRETITKFFVLGKLRTELEDVVG